MATLSIDTVRKTFGAVTVLHDVSLEIGDGEFLVLLGPSGCGKSTLLSMIAGLEDISAGEIRIDGQRMNERHAKERDIAMVFQSYALYPTMTVRQNIEFGMKVRKVPKAECQAAVGRVAELLQITPLLERKPSQLSGGQRQRVAIGRALVRDPKLFLFDEPLSNLDAQLRVDMRTEIKKLHQRLRTTIVYVTHDQIEAMTMATKVAVMKDGYIQQFADPTTVYEAPETLYVARFVGSPAMNIVPGMLNESGRVDIVPGDISISGIGLSQQAIRTFAGRKVLLGIRPENIYKADGTQDGSFDAFIDVVEPTGPDTLAFFRLGEADAIARLQPKSVESGEKVRLAVDAAKVVLFDPATERRIR